MRVRLNGQMVDWVEAVIQMDGTITRTLEYLYPCTEQHFMDVYAQEHEKRHGKPFRVHRR